MASPIIPHSAFRILHFLLCLAHLLVLVFLARQHPFGNFATETDFYQFYAPDAERIAAGQFPLNTYQGPGYPALLAIINRLSGGDLFLAGKWLSVICAVICGWLVFILFSRAFGDAVGIGAQLIAIVSGEFPQFSINAATDIFFLLICLATLVALTGDRLSVRWRVTHASILTGLAYLTRYNGVFLLAAFLIGVVLLNLFEESRRERAKLAVIILAVFLITVMPWLTANYRHHGSPFYNTNYLNMATEFYPELVAGKTNQDATRALEQRFKSFGDVLNYDPKRVLAHYPANLLESVRLSIFGELVNRWVGCLAVLGVLLALIERRSKLVLLLLTAGAIYLLLMALNHWETRYYFFIMVLLAGFAVGAVARLSELAQRVIRLASPADALVPTLLVAALCALSLAESGKDVKRFLAAQPWEILAARDYLTSANPSGAHLRIVARKPHLPYLARGEWVFFPQVRSIEEFRLWVESNRVDYIAIGKRELKERKELAPLGDPEKAPDWLKAVWVHDDPPFILYRPVENRQD